MEREDMDGFHALIMCTGLRFRGPEASMLTSRPHYCLAAADMQRGWSGEGQTASSSSAVVDVHCLAVSDQRQRDHGLVGCPITLLVSCLSAGVTHLD